MHKRVYTQKQKKKNQAATSHAFTCTSTVFGNSNDFEDLRVVFQRFNMVTFSPTIRYMLS